MEQSLLTLTDLFFLIKYNIKKHINQGRNIGYDYI